MYIQKVNLTFRTREEIPSQNLKQCKQELLNQATNKDTDFGKTILKILAGGQLKILLDMIDDIQDRINTGSKYISSDRADEIYTCLRSLINELGNSYNISMFVVDIEILCAHQNFIPFTNRNYKHRYFGINYTESITQLKSIILTLNNRLQNAIVHNPVNANNGIEYPDTKMYTEKKAVMTISEKYKKYKIRNLELIQTKTYIFQLMEFVCSYFKIVPTADVVNNYNNPAQNKQTSEYRTDLSHSITNEKFGNCGEQAYLLFYLIREHPEIPQNFKNQTKVVQLQFPEDHTFVIIGKTSDDNAIVIDPWIKFINLIPREGHRKDISLAETRTRGFLGKRSQYVKFLNDHPDGEYIKKNRNHNIIHSPLQIDKSIYQEVLNDYYGHK